MTEEESKRGGKGGGRDGLLRLRLAMTEEEIFIISAEPVIIKENHRGQ